MRKKNLSLEKKKRIISTRPAASSARGAERLCVEGRGLPGVLEAVLTSRQSFLKVFPANSEQQAGTGRVKVSTDGSGSRGSSRIRHIITSAVIHQRSDSHYCHISLLCRLEKKAQNDEYFLTLKKKILPWPHPRSCDHMAGRLHPHFDTSLHMSLSR